MSEETTKAILRQQRADKVLRACVMMGVIYMIAVGTISAVFTYKTQTAIARNQKINAKASEDRFQRYTEDNAVQHRQTQQYILCVANVLLKPQAARKPIDFQQCGVSGTSNTVLPNTLSDIQDSTQSAFVVQPQPPSNTTTQQNTTSAPPDPPSTVQGPNTPGIIEQLTNPINTILTGVL